MPPHLRPPSALILSINSRRNEEDNPANLDHWIARATAGVHRLDGGGLAPMLYADRRNGALNSESWCRRAHGGRARYRHREEIDARTIELSSGRPLVLAKRSPPASTTSAETMARVSGIDLRQGQGLGGGRARTEQQHGFGCGA